MGAALLVARSRLRRNVLATVLLIVLAGVAGGVVVAAIAGIRRADAGWEALQAAYPDVDAVAVVLTPDFESPTPSKTVYEDEVKVIRGFPGVTEAGRAMAMVATLRKADTSQEPRPSVPFVALDRLSVALFGRPIVVAGRPAAPEADDEAVIDEEQASLLDVGLGDRIEVTPFTGAQFGALETGAIVPAEGPTSVVEVVGIQREPADLLGSRTSQYTFFTSDPALVLSPAWWRANGPDVSAYGTIIAVDLEDGPAGLEAFSQRMEETFDVGVSAPGLEFNLGIPVELRSAIDGRITAEGRALAAFALVTALVAALVVGQALLRQMRTEQADQPALAALGLGQRDLLVVGLLRSLGVAVGAGILTAVVATGLSARVPVGVGARVLRSQGVTVDVPVVAAGSLMVAVLVLGLGGVASARTPRERSARPATVADRVGGLGASIVATLGLRMAFDRTAAGRAGRAAVGAAAAAIAVLVAAGGLVASYGALTTEPARVGQPWDIVAGNFASADGVTQAVADVAAIEGVEAIGGELSATAELNGRDVTLVAYTEELGRLEPTVFVGRAPVADDEIMLGERLARDLELGVGDEVEVHSEPREVLRVVGIGSAGASVDDTAPGTSALVTGAALRGDGNIVESPQVLLVRLAADADFDAVYARIEDKFPDTTARSPILARTVQTVGALGWLPRALAGLVSLLATGAVVNALVGSVRQRRRDLAVLKAIGCDRGQVAQVVAWQATGWGVVAALVGVPLGLVLASVGWKAVVRSLGLQSPTTISWWLIGSIVVAVLVIVNVVALFPARAAARIPAAEALRTE